MKRKIMMTAVSLFSFLLCALFGIALFQYTTPMQETVYDLSLSWEGEGMPEDWIYDQKGWRVFTESGDLTADEIGGFYGAVQPHQTFYYSRTLMEELSAPTLRLFPGSNSIAVFLDDLLLYTDQPELTGSIGDLALTPLEWYRDTAVTLSLPADYEGKTLTIAQSTGLPEVEHDHFTVYPCAVSLYCGYAYESTLIAESFHTSIPAVLCFAAGTVLLLFFVLSLYRGHNDTGLLWAALTVFLWMLSLLQGMSFLSEYKGESIIDWAIVFRLFSMTALLAFLSSRAGKYRIIPWSITVVSAVCCCIYLFIEWKYEFIENNFVMFLSGSLPQLVGMVGLLGTLILGWTIWRKEKRFYALFSPFVFAGIGVALLWAAISHGRMIWQQFQLALTYLTPAYFLWPLILVFTLASVLSAILEFAEQEIARRAETRMYKDRSELAMQSYESLCLQNEQVQMLRHDLMKHYTALRQMTDEQQRTRYLDELIGQNENIRPVVQSGNSILDIILNGKLSQAISAGVHVEVLRCTAPERLPLSDSNLCSVVMNLVENAIHAATMPGTSKPYIRLDMHIKNDYFVFILENSVPKKSKKETAQKHGLGLKIVHHILENFSDLIVAEQGEGYYKVTFAIPL